MCDWNWFNHRVGFVINLYTSPQICSSQIIFLQEILDKFGGSVTREKNGHQSYAAPLDACHLILFVCIGCYLQLPLLDCYYFLSFYIMHRSFCRCKSEFCNSQNRLHTLNWLKTSFLRKICPFMFWHMWPISPLLIMLCSFCEFYVQMN